MANFTNNVGATHLTARAGQQPTGAPNRWPSVDIDPATLATHGVTLERNVYYDEYSGTREGLIAAGLVADGFFPGDAGRRKSICRYDMRWQPSQGPISVQRYNKKFLVRVRVSIKEQNDRKAGASLAEGAWRKKLAEAEAEVKAAEAQLADAPASRKDFTCRAAESFWAGYHIFFCSYSGQLKVGGYSFSAADREKFDAMARRMYWEIRGARPKLDQAHRMKGVVAARAKAAKADLPLQMMLKAVSTDASQPDAQSA